ncbi:MAG TPA: GTP pyrophosphokinase family protein [Bacilli bacterium]|nr:GTP pyrophosphokinase family protein [Bacilli bacterium]HQA19287.1 GTP pyrophosphokinase family protein [Bacilli bacterium]HQD91711.1 GTP pyrophosphokinase family protein [Bacilli bacterium]
MMNEKDFRWEIFLQPYEMAVQSFIIKLEAIKKQHILKGLKNPIEIVTGRVKSPESILDKAKRLGISLEEIPDKIYDIAGVRITCKYMQDVYEVAEMIKNRKDLEVVEVRDYIKNPKASGYKSLHIIAKYNVETIDGQIPINMEFQIRTHAMHLWASIEHSLKYKFLRNIPEDIKARLFAASEAATALDLEMSKIKQLVESLGGEGIRRQPYPAEQLEIYPNNMKKW